MVPSFLWIRCSTPSIFAAARPAACASAFVSWVLDARSPPSRLFAQPFSVGTVCTFFLSAMSSPFTLWALGWSLLLQLGQRYPARAWSGRNSVGRCPCLLYTSDAADDLTRVD